MINKEEPFIETSEVVVFYISIVGKVYTVKNKS